ncbi:MAG: NAD(P)H-dependent oxidoreductase [Gammaproteobacteria bacterium]|nr:NAD(P)H-dependent oxidoreductase [Gammaproteobacteria bacterium]MDH3447294.1 NAD(P)H-dependent oxidoreductase [Gammaproteobacteria bacterium]
MPARILILFAHPSQHRSEVNLPLVRASSNVDGVTVIDLYAEYPDYCIDIDREQQRLRANDVIVFMFPLYWYSTPAILKEWQDLVLEYGFAYGHGGNVLRGKRLLCAVTAGGTEDAYRTSGFNHYSIRELLRPIEQTATLCGMVYLPPYALFGSRTALDDGRVDAHVDNWRRILDCLLHDRIDIAMAEKAEKLNECVAPPDGESA